MNYREELFKALTAGVDGVFRDKSIDALVEVCKAARKEGYNAGIKDGNISDDTFAEKVKEAYENGANDAWECAKDLALKGEYDQYKRFEIFGNTDVDNIFTLLTGAEALVKLKKYEEEQKEPAFKVGDRVRATGECDKYGIELFPVGTIGEVMDVDCDGDYLVKAYEAYAAPYYYPNDALELANDVILVGDEVYFLVSNYHGVVTAVWDDCGVVKTERLTQNGKLACDDAKDLHRTGRRFPEIANILKQMQEGNE